MVRCIGVRVAEKSDIPLIFELESESFGEYGYPFFFFRQAYDCWPNGIILIKENNHLLGYILQVPSLSNTKDSWILSIAVSPQARRKGIAKSLLKMVIKNSHQYERLLLTVRPSNTVALNLYLSLGFVTIDKEEDYFGVGESRLKLAYIYK